MKIRIDISKVKQPFEKLLMIKPRHVASHVMYVGKDLGHLII